MSTNRDDQVLATFAKKLTSNDPIVRSRNLKKLRNLLMKLKDDVSELSMLQLWKGLHYVMWMADKPLVQEQLADDLASMVHFLPTKSLSLRYFDAFLKISRKEWGSLDSIRQDKFMRLTRFSFRQILTWLKNNHWEVESVSGFCKTLERCFLSKEGASGDLFHILDLLLQEIGNVSDGEIPEDLVKNLCNSFIEIMSRIDSKYLAKAIKQNFFSELKKDTFKLDVSAYQDKVMSVASQKSVKNRALLYSLVK